jgi:hypothetical protein
MPISTYPIASSIPPLSVRGYQQMSMAIVRPGNSNSAPGICSSSRLFPAFGTCGTLYVAVLSRDGGTGRRSGLKIRRASALRGSTPRPGTIVNTAQSFACGLHRLLLRGAPGGQFCGCAQFCAYQQLRCEYPVDGVGLRMGGEFMVHLFRISQMRLITPGELEGRIVEIHRLCYALTSEGVSQRWKRYATHTASLNPLLNVRTLPHQQCPFEFDFVFRIRHN